MKKSVAWYWTYFGVFLVLSLIALIALQRDVAEINRKVAAAHEQVGLIEQVVIRPPAAKPPVPAVNTAAAEQAERIQKALVPVTIMPTPAPVPTPEPQHYYVPRATKDLMPLEGWNDQPNKNRPGRVHTELMVRWGVPFAAHAASRPPCLRSVRKPIERLSLPHGGGYVDVLTSRIVQIPCR